MLLFQIHWFIKQNTNKHTTSTKCIYQSDWKLLRIKNEKFQNESFLLLCRNKC